MSCQSSLAEHVLSARRITQDWRSSVILQPDTTQVFCQADWPWTDVVGFISC